MPKIIIHDIPVISFDYHAREKYWTALSVQLIDSHGKGPYSDHAQVEGLLLECFNFFVKQFEQLLAEENSLTFYLYIFMLHEESIKLYRKLLGGLKLHTIDESEFAGYRRILKNILEQGCNHNLSWGALPDQQEANRINEKLQELLYLGTWMYHFADNVALQKMIEQCHRLYFNKENLLVVDWQFHYGTAYHQLFPQLQQDYENGTFDENAVTELVAAIDKNFGIEYGWASGLIFEAKKHHNPDHPELQTIEPYILPANLAAHFGITQESAEAFYGGLTLSRANKMSVENLVLKPYSLDRYMYRPILVYTINGVERALVGWEKFSESIVTLATNAIHWNNIPREWSKNKGMQDFINKKGLEHDRVLEDKIEAILKAEKLLYVRNIKSFKRPGTDNINIDNATCGEIDFIVVNQALQKIFVADTKYNRARYDAVGYRNDYTNFTGTYETKLERKRSWVEQNIHILEGHLKIINNIDVLDLSTYVVEGIFFINTPTFYMFNGNYQAVTLFHIREFLLGTYALPQIPFMTEKGLTQISHPYFKKPV